MSLFVHNENTYNNSNVLIRIEIINYKYIFNGVVKRDCDSSANSHERENGSF